MTNVCVLLFVCVLFFYMFNVTEKIDQTKQQCFNIDDAKMVKI